MAKAPRVLRKVKIGEKWEFASVHVVNGRMDFANVVFKGEKIAASEGTLYLDWREPDGARRRVKVEGGAAGVKRALRAQAHVVQLRRMGVEAEDALELQRTAQAEGKSIREVVEAFKESAPARLAKKSVLKYRNALDTFAKWAASQRISHVSQVDKDVLDRWMRHMRDKDGLDNGTVVDKVVIVKGELNRNGAAIKIRERDLPSVTQREVVEYTPEDLQPLFAAANPDERTLFKTLLLSGLREQEAMYLTVEDIGAKRSTLRVSRKPEMGFTPKNYQERTIAVPTALIAELLEHCKRHKRKTGLLFTTSDVNKRSGTPGGQCDTKMLRRLKTLALRAGVNCGRCRSTHENKAVNCTTHPVCAKYTLHKFRHTFAVTQLRDGMDIISVQRQLGHKDLDSTRKYLRALAPDELQAKVEAGSLTKFF